ncbi:dCTP deaminase, dUMP-forming [subsurface metagenome]
MTVLGSKRLKELIYHTKKMTQRLVVTPILDQNAQISDASAAIDIRLGTKFIVPQKANVPYIDIGELNFLEEFKKSVVETYVPYGEALTLHPGHFVLGNSLEYFRFPYNLSGYVVTRSSWGRLGLVVATAIGIHPGFFGVLCLELSNSGEVPISLYPGLAIAQVFFHEVTADPTAKPAYSAYLGATEVELSQLSPHEEIEKLKRLTR